MLKTEKRAIPFEVTDPERIAVQRYYDEEFYKLECERVWPHVWQMACRLEEIPKVGDWVEYRILNWSVILVRTTSGIKAFHNACRHRGVQVASGRGNCKNRGFICPFHGWRYNMDGENIFVFGRQLFTEHNLEAAELSLAPCRVELWGGCAFINFDDNAPPLRAGLGPMADRLEARNVDKLKVDAWLSTVLPTNWKLAMEAFMEGFHVMRTHPQLIAVAPPEANRFGLDMGTSVRPITPREYIDNTVCMIGRLAVGMGGLVTPGEVAIAERLGREMELPEDTGSAAKMFFTRFREDVTSEGRARGVPVFDLSEVAATHKFIGVEFIFPHFFPAAAVQRHVVLSYPAARP